MDKIIDFLQDFNIWTVAIRLVLAMIIGGVIGLERNKQGRAAGMRTHILVCLGSALAAMIGLYTSEVLGVNNDPLRIAAQVVSGIGFLGVGTILIKGRFQITGLTTAAGLWTAAAVGLALGVGFYEGAVITFLFAVLTVTVVHRLEYTINKKYSRFGIYVEIRGDSEVRKTLDFLSSHFMVTDIQVTSPRSGTVGNIGIEANVHNRDFKTSPEAVTAALEGEEQVAFALESI
ncbi:MAG: MgtC/SapB family protein [Clostridia bacterium]|nr:MgtC/SapB family protein [Clostridia bacterium]